MSITQIKEVLQQPTFGEMIDAFEKLRMEQDKHLKAHTLNAFRNIQMNVHDLVSQFDRMFLLLNGLGQSLRSGGGYAFQRYLFVSLCTMAERWNKQNEDTGAYITFDMEVPFSLYLLLSKYKSKDVIEYENAVKTLGKGLTKKTIDAHKGENDIIDMLSKTLQLPNADRYMDIVCHIHDSDGNDSYLFISAKGGFNNTATEDDLLKKNINGEGNEEVGYILATGTIASNGVHREYTLATNTIRAGNVFPLAKLWDDILHEMETDNIGSFGQPDFSLRYKDKDDELNHMSNVLKEYIGKISDNYKERLTKVKKSITSSSVDLKQIVKSLTDISADTDDRIKICIDKVWYLFGVYDSYMDYFSDKKGNASSKAIDSFHIEMGAITKILERAGDDRDSDASKAVDKLGLMLIYQCDGSDIYEVNDENKDRAEKILEVSSPYLNYFLNTLENENVDVYDSTFMFQRGLPDKIVNAEGIDNGEFIKDLKKKATMWTRKEYVSLKRDYDAPSTESEEIMITPIDEYRDEMNKIMIKLTIKELIDQLNGIVKSKYANTLKSHLDKYLDLKHYSMLKDAGENYIEELKTEKKFKEIKHHVNIGTIKLAGNSAKTIIVSEVIRGWIDKQKEKEQLKEMYQKLFG